MKLTDLATAGGCAAKYSAARLEELLRGFVPAEAENLLVGLDPADDAAVYKLDDERALVFTIDFFPPIVDDPDDFGTIAATNALNDVFAMGGRPLLALSVAALPEELPTEVVRAIFDGAERQVREAGAILAGGHTIRDAEPKYGLAVVGTVAPDGIWPKAGARAGRRALPDEAARHGARARRREARPRRHRRGGALDADAEPRRGRRAAPARAERRHRRDRASGSPVTRTRWRRAAACASCSTRRGCRRSTARSTRHAPASRRRARATTATYAAARVERRRAGARRARLRPADRGRAARLAARATRRCRSRRSSRAAGLFLARVGASRKAPGYELA